LIGCSVLNNPDGLSGSPVFQINEKSQEAFAGILIRSSSKFDIAYFLEHKRIIDTLTNIHEGRYTSKVVQVG
jgi:hypothetical protein